MTQGNLAGKFLDRAVGTTIVSALPVLLLLAAGCSPALQEEVPEVVEAPAGPEVEVAANLAFTEGPAVDAEGNVFFTETTQSRIMKLATDGTLSVFRSPSHGANGLLFDEQFRLLACESGDRRTINPRITRTNMETGEVEVVAEHYQGKRFHAPNDITIDGQGRLYFSDRPGANSAPDQVGVNAIYRVDPDGAVAQILAEPDIDRPNGLVISPDDKTFYLIEAHPDEGRARMIRAYDLLPDGSVTNMRVFHDFYPGRSGDGMTIDTEGNLYVAAGLHSLRNTSETLDTKPGVHVFAPDGTLKQFVPIPEDTITNTAFGGPDMKTVYVTAGKTLFRFQSDIAGLRR